MKAFLRQKKSNAETLEMAGFLISFKGINQQINNGLEFILTKK